MNDKPKTRRYKLTIAYDGGAYAGFQLQDNGPSIQQALEEALLHVAREPVKTFGSGRTDAGVHAMGQVVHCDISKPIPPLNLRRALNARLPEDIRVMRVKIVPDDFDARKSTHGKEYRYFLYNADILPPTERPFRAFFKKPLNLKALRDAARRFEGRHDFVSFAANPNRDIYTTVRTIYKFTVTKSGPLIRCGPWSGSLSAWARVPRSQRRLLSSSTRPHREPQECRPQPDAACSCGRCGTREWSLKYKL